MASFGKIYSYPNNPRVMKIQAAGNLNSLNITVDPNFQMGVTNRSPEFLAKFPMGKAPAFEGTDGTLLFESDAIAQYVAESGPAKDQLLGASAVERAHIRQWSCFGEGDGMGAVVPFALWHMKLAQYSAEELEAQLAKVERVVGAVEAHLKAGDRKWLATEEKLSLADISVAAALNWAFGLLLDEELRAKYPAVVAWYERTIESEGVKQAFGEKKFIDKRPAFQ
ncbi:translation elongation factor eEF-1B gamma subunit [Aspergillus nomiae NRRL 13137]|uniref:Translation elongation factor eEF-1B gamma subunit n=1 Tax=Aspergillus nomiae NRRL (strain ATCC 15546 / NRRL 13137 / CBS 260.88 / M93) TaxID=1509407 RepID=A0A0L1J9U7_ASPN3|nr:translation elongation factor eEF-1B gamma subunit [Aspergillus nomiae NRRL 13137]KNG88487.1 translation elongation factor eEF-1B gamma subunit [Aspergillus nomiae NRRL 13137]